MTNLLHAGIGVATVWGLLAISGCGGSCIDDGFAWQQGVNCGAASVGGTESASATDTDSGDPTEASASNSNSASASETASETASASNSASQSASATETASASEPTGTATESASDSDTEGGMFCEDVDGDGFGDPDKCSPEMMPGSVPNDDDCDDSDVNTFPGSAEKDSETKCERDEDGDGWGDNDPPPGVDPGTDCADGDAAVHDTCGCTPGALSCVGDDLHECDALGMMENVTPCEFGCDDGGLQCWDAMIVDAGPSVCIDPDAQASLLAMVSGGDGVYAYAWTPADTLDDPTVADPKAMPASATQYTVDVSDGEGNMGSDSVTVFVKDQSLELSPQTCTVFDFPHEVNDENMDPVSSWMWNDQTKELCETLNAKGSALFCGWELDNATISGNFEVKTAEDDDWVGFMWGMQDTSHFYVFTWKQAGQLATTCGNVQVPAGMQVKVVDVADPMADPMACVDIHAAADTANSKLLVAAADFTTTGWADNTQYRFQLTHKADGEMTIVVRRANNNMLVAEKTFMDTTYASGDFAMYTKSQVNTCFSNFTVDCEP